MPNQNLDWPDVAKFILKNFNVRAHSRGGGGEGGDFSYARGSGATWRGQIDVVPMRFADALAFRAFLHSLRGKSGSFLLQIPSSLPAQSNVPVTYSDGTIYTDGTTYSDFLGGVLGADVLLGELIAPTTVRGETISINQGLVPAPFIRVGGVLAVGDIETDGQLLRITANSGTLLTVRPRLRAIHPIGTEVRVGRVVGKFRLDQRTPPVPLTGPRSSTVGIQFAEFY